MGEAICLRKEVKMNESFNLIDRHWKEFFLEDVVIINSGKRLTKADMKFGNMPFIGASEANNGITMFTSSSNESLDSNVLGVNYNGSVGFSFYHPYEALFSDDVKRVKWIDESHNNRYTLLFLSTVIRQQKDKYAYGYKFNAQRMKRQKVLLPITKENLLDWQFMEDYMKAKEQQILKPTIEKLCKYLIINEIITGGVNYLMPIGKHFISQKYSRKYSEANGLKRPITQREKLHTYRQPLSTMVWMDLLETKAA